ncbi:Hypothetical protein R9X50_00262400 [Acrodontium crateriforme]|uniref:Uncharacterized protein n=1 Tax=Acrodontium crateriforme TaxID=150365 RepID=A0AAQ3R8P0_9PEZI|nr:Hypothetical protein R9X50_00262400 [Acrodontium crateriforme]
MKMSDQRLLPPLLTLPLELRQQIYKHLLPAQRITHPLPGVGITSVSHRLPSSALLNIHPKITDEILAYYYSVATWKLIFSHAFNFFRVDPDLAALQRSHVLSRMRKVEVVFFCDILLLRDYPSFGLNQFCAEIKRRADKACDVLAGARELKTVIVSWIDTTQTNFWEEKARILEPLRKLALNDSKHGGNVSFKLGEINGPDDLDREMFMDAMRRVLGENHQFQIGLDGTIESERQPADLRMLAFDVRQQREDLESLHDWSTASWTKATV